LISKNIENWEKSVFLKIDFGHFKNVHFSIQHYNNRGIFSEIPVTGNFYFIKIPTVGNLVIIGIPVAGTIVCFFIIPVAGTIIFGP
jgi:hypothetical protein